jgi:hypothetical protein
VLGRTFIACIKGDILMDTARSDNPATFVKPAIRSGQFLAGTCLVGIDIIGTAVLFLRRLNELPFGAAASLGAAIVLLVGAWRLAMWQYERIAQALATTGSGESASILSACAKYIERGLVVLGLVSLMFLTSVVQVSMK